MCDSGVLALLELGFQWFKAGTSRRHAAHSSLSQTDSGSHVLQTGIRSARLFDTETPPTCDTISPSVIILTSLIEVKGAPALTALDWLTTSFPISLQSCGFFIRNTQGLAAPRRESCCVCTLKTPMLPSLCLDSFTAGSVLIFTHKCPGVIKSQMKYFLYRQPPSSVCYFLSFPPFFAPSLSPALWHLWKMRGRLWKWCCSRRARRPEEVGAGEL